MTDHQARHLQRQALDADPHAQAALLVARRRANEAGAWVPCPDCKGDGHFGVVARDPIPGVVFGGAVVCARCNGTGQAPMPWDDRLALAAHCSDPSALLLSPEDAYPPPGAYVAQHWPWRLECNCSSRDLLLRVQDARTPYEPLRSEEGEIWRSGESWTCPACGEESPKVYGLALADWLNGLKRRPPVVLTRAAVAAARAVLCPCHLRDWLEDRCGRCDRTRAEGIRIEVTIEAAERWLADPTEANRKAWRAAGAKTEWLSHGQRWIPNPTLKDDAEAIQVAAGHTDEDTVRQAICADLVAWVLG